MKSKKSKKLNLKFFLVLYLFAFMPMLISVCFIGVVSTNINKSNLEKNAREKLYIVSSNLASHCQDNNISFATSDSYNDYLDSLLDKDIEMAILLDRCPAVTSIKNESGYRVREINIDVTVDNISKEGMYIDSLMIENQEYKAYFVPIYSDDNIIGIAMAAQSAYFINESVKKTTTMCVVSSCIVFVVFVIVLIIVSRRILDSFKRLGTKVEALSSGDLGESATKASFISEMNVLQTATDNMQSNLRNTIGKVKDESEQIADNIREVAELSESTSNRAQVITEAMGELTKAAMGMTENVQGISDHMILVGEDINDISDSIAQLQDNTHNMMSANEAAKESIEQIMESSMRSVSAMDSIVKQISETNDSIKEIDSVVDLILGIAEETSLLSLNASIEAARAGEAGRGFAVVADAIRKLSEQSSDGAGQIRSIAMTITEESEKSVEYANEVQDLINQEQEVVAETKQQYERLNDDIEQSVRAVNAIAQKTSNLSVAKERVIENIMDLTAISQENEASNEQVSANVCEIIEEIHIVNKNCEDVKGMAGRLEETVSFFHY